MLEISSLFSSLYIWLEDNQPCTNIDRWYFTYQACYVTFHQPLVTTARYVGKLVGRYYDSEGNSTKFLKGVEAKAARGAQLLEKQKNEEAKVPSCNSRWSQDEGSEVSFYMLCLNMFTK